MIPLSRYDKVRIAPPKFWQGTGGLGDDSCGCFKIGRLRVIATVGDDWEHISVSREDRTPSWEEMSMIARKFFGNEPAMQLHVPSDDHVNYHKYCLHWWRPIGQEIPRPPYWMVGPKAATPEENRHGINSIGNN